MYITKEMVESFSKDVISLAKDCKNFYGDMYIDIKQTQTGLLINIYSSNGYTKSRAFTISQSFVKSWDRVSCLLDKHSNFLRERGDWRSVSYSGEGEYEEDYGMSVQFYFDFVETVCRSKEGYALQYYKIKKELFTFLKRVVKDDYYSIEDKGSFCDISGYFRYDYEKEEVYITGRVHLYEDEERYLQVLLKDLLLCLSDIGAPIHSVTIDRLIPHPHSIKYLYFYSIGNECILWNDFKYNNSCSVYN